MGDGHESSCSSIAFPEVTYQYRVHHLPLTIEASPSLFWAERSLDGKDEVISDMAECELRSRKAAGCLLVLCYEAKGPSTHGVFTGGLGFNGRHSHSTIHGLGRASDPTLDA